MKPYTNTPNQRGIIGKIPSHNGGGPSPTVGRMMIYKAQI